MTRSTEACSKRVTGMKLSLNAEGTENAEKKRERLEFLCVLRPSAFQNNLKARQPSSLEHLAKYRLKKVSGPRLFTSPYCESFRP